MALVINNIAHPPYQMQWKKTDQGFIKCNLDAAIFKEEKYFGIGKCLHDNNGLFIKARTCFFNGISQPSEA
ncbi:hypothetical protein GmHk_12G033889 [Glycine max]|nr:hypothetical protein GmHk_12G033889 [Glycine max]